MPKTYTSDREWIKELLTYEDKSGSPSGGKHKNYGYNRTEAPKFKNIEEAVDYFVENDLPFIKQQYPGDIIERAKAGDYIFNTGKDPKLYSVNQYLNDNKDTVDKNDLDYINSNRSNIKDAMVDGVVGFKYGDPADSIKINELYDKYVRSIPNKQRVSNLDDARNFYYQNTNVGSGSFKATWEGRTNKYGGYTGKQTKGREVTENPTADIINNDMPKDNIKGTLKKEEQLTIGDRTINITDGYGIRGKDFKNREGQHSTGIDITTDNKRVISLTDGVVEVASLQGSPTLVGTDKEKSGGYYLIIKNDDGTRSQYMHLDAMTPDEQKNIIGKKIKRGDDLGGYGIGSGSGTGPHVKYRVFTGEIGTQSASHIDPSTYISGNNEPPSPPKQNLIVGEDEEGKFVETLINKGTENEKYVKEYVKGAEQLGIRTIGDTEYVVKGYTDDNSVLQTEYLSPSKSNKIGLKKENKTKLYKREINNVISNGITNESQEKARSIAETAREDFESSTDLDKREKEQLSFQISREYYRKVAAPKLQEQTKKLKEYETKKLFDLKNEYSNTNNKEEKQKIGEQIKIEQRKFDKIVKKDKDINRQIKAFELTTKLSGSSYNTSSDKNDFLSKELLQFKEYENLINKPFEQDIVDIGTEYNKKLIEEEEAKNTAVNNVKSDNGTVGGTNKTEFNTATTKNPLTGTNDKKEDPDNLENESEDYDKSGKDYYDKDYLEEQLAEVQKQLSNSKKAEEFTPDLSALESKDKYGNLIAQAGDLGAGIIGLQGAMEEVPVYNKGERFNQYTEEAYNQRNMGLSAEESGLRKQLAERGFGYDVKNIRRLSGGSAGVALGNLGRASSGLQNRYAQIAAEDSAVRRMNQQRFDRSAMADESFNRRKFEDSFKTTMLNKEMGAQLVRDKMKNMNERAQFEKQYGEGSIYNEISKEVLTGKQYNNHALKMAEQYQKQKAEDYLSDRQKRIESDLKKANK